MSSLSATCCSNRVAILKTDLQCVGSLVWICKASECERSCRLAPNNKSWQGGAIRCDCYCKGISCVCICIATDIITARVSNFARLVCRCIAPNWSWIYFVYSNVKSSCHNLNSSSISNWVIILNGDSDSISNSSLSVGWWGNSQNTS